jgi:hypothetical protein
LYREFLKTGNTSAIKELNKTKSLVYPKLGGTKRRKTKKNKTKILL